MEPETARHRQRALFYLPVVTPWWFDNIVIHLIRVMASAYDVHVMVPPLWRNTGIERARLDSIPDLNHVHWHLLDGPRHPALRSDASDETDLIALVHQIGPDLVLCRSADIATPALFPGTVRYIMEGGAPPFRTGPNWVWLSPSLFDHGVLPTLSNEEIKALDALAEPLWAAQNSRLNLPTWDEFWAQTSLSDDKQIIGLPLEYEHEENFFSQHHIYPTNAEMITRIAAQLNDETTLAVTNHPLNELYGDNTAIHAAIADANGKVALLDNDEAAGQSTLALAHHGDGMIVGNSKSWAVCAAVGTPMMRLSDFATGGWMHAYTALSSFLADIVANRARRPDPTEAQRWFAYHLANCVFDPSDPALCASDIAIRMRQPVDPARWERGIATYHTQFQAEIA